MAGVQANRFVPGHGVRLLPSSTRSVNHTLRGRAGDGGGAVPSACAKRATGWRARSRDLRAGPQRWLCCWTAGKASSAALTSAQQPETAPTAAPRPLPPTTLAVSCAGLPAGSARRLLQQEDDQRRATARRGKIAPSPRSSSSSRTWACRASPTANSAAPISTSTFSTSWAA